MKYLHLSNITLFTIVLLITYQQPESNDRSFNLMLIALLLSNSVLGLVICRAQSRPKD